MKEGATQPPAGRVWVMARSLRRVSMTDTEVSPPKAVRVITGGQGATVVAMERGGRPGLGLSVDTCRGPLIEPGRGWSCRAAGSGDSCVPLVLWLVARPERTDKRGEAATMDNGLPANRGQLGALSWSPSRRAVFD